ncbi:MAG: ATP-binding protein, partial [Chloroflexaceae bacterium]
EGRERERRFHLADVEEVITAPEFDRDGTPYFSGVWWQAEQSHPPGQPALLCALAPHPDGLPFPALAQAAGLEPEPARAALDMLEQHDVVAQHDGRYGYTVELMRRWVVRRKVGGF